MALKVPASWLGLDPSRMSVKVAFAVADPKTTGGFHANLNLLVTAVPAGTTIRQAYLFTHTAPAGAKGAFRPTFLASARTITFLVRPSGSA